MGDAMPLAPPSARGQLVVGIALGVAGLVTLLAGRTAVSVFVAVVVGAAYFDLRRLLAQWGHVITALLGAAGVGAFLWCGYADRLDLLPMVAGALMLALLVSRVLLNELRGRPGGVTSDVAATLGAAGVAGVFGAHVLLIRSVPMFGFRGLLVFGLMVLLNDACAFLVGTWRGRRQITPRISPGKTWEGTLAGFTASVIVGVVAGAVLDPPFGLWSGLALGAGVGVVAPVGDLVFSAIKRSAGAKGSGSYLGPLGGALDVTDGVLFAAPPFYWALRTLAL